MSNKRQIAIKIVVGVSLIIGVYLIGGRRSSIRPKTPVKIDSGNRLVMGTFARVVAIASNADTAKQSINKAMAEIEKTDKLMSDYKSDSEISQVNRDGFNQAVKVSGPTFEVLQKSVAFSKLTEGAFDVTIGPLVDLWRSAGEANSVPDDDQLRQARSRIGFEKLLLDPNQMTVRFLTEGMRIDLGGIAKGYAVDKAIEAMQQSGAQGGMIDIGGDIRCFGTPPKGKKYWRIGLQDPSDTRTDPGAARYFLVLKLTNAAVATSGDYQRFTLIEGEKHSHIINTETGRTSSTLSSVTIISQNATDADALSTAVTVMGPQKGLPLIETIPETEAILISSPPNYMLIKTSGALKYIATQD